MAFQLEDLDFGALSDEELQPILEHINRTYGEIQPRKVDITPDELRVFMTSPGMIRNDFLLRDESGDLIGTCETRYPEDGSNPDVLRCQVFVRAEHRRHRAGTLMLGHIARMAEALNRTKLLTMHFDTVPSGAAFARAVGGQEKLQSHMNVVRIDDLDLELLKGWVEQGPLRAPGYTAEVREGDLPEELLEQIAYLYYVLERDMPTSEGHEPLDWSADLVRRMRDRFKGTVDSIWAMAFDDETKQPVGMSELIRRRTDPSTWIVTVTMVDPDHRGRSLGKWLKGAVNLAALEAWDGGVYQETGNAFTNEAMLAINRAMGFRHELTMTDVEIAVDDALGYVASMT
jgi:mycothiol synthase